MFCFWVNCRTLKNQEGERSKNWKWWKETWILFSPCGKLGPVHKKRIRNLKWNSTKKKSVRKQASKLLLQKKETQIKKVCDKKNISRQNRRRLCARRCNQSIKWLWGKLFLMQNCHLHFCSLFLPEFWVFKLSLCCF